MRTFFQAIQTLAPGDKIYIERVRMSGKVNFQDGSEIAIHIGSESFAPPMLILPLNHNGGTAQTEQIEELIQFCNLLRDGLPQLVFLGAKQVNNRVLRNFSAHLQGDELDERDHDEFGRWHVLTLEVAT